MGYWDRFEEAQTPASPWARALSFRNVSLRDPGAPATHPTLNRTDGFANLSVDDGYIPPDALTKYGSFPAIKDDWSDKSTLSGFVTDAATPATPAALSNLPLPESSETISAPQKQSRSQELMKEYYGLQNLDPKTLDTNDDSMIMNVGKQLALSLRNLESPLMNPNVSDKQAYGMALGTAISAAVKGLVSPYDDERQTLEYQKQKMVQDIAMTQTMEQEDLQTRTGEKQIEAIDSQIGKREQEVINLQEKIKTDAAKNRTELVKSYSKRYEKQMTFDPSTDADDRAVNERMIELGEVPFAEKRAGVKRVERIYDAGSEKMMLKEYYTDGKEKTGWMQANGKFTDNKEAAGTFKSERVRSSEVQAAASITNTNTRTAASLKETAMKISADIKANVLKDQAKIKALRVGIMLAKAQGKLDDEGLKEALAAFDEVYPDYVEDQ